MKKLLFILSMVPFILFSCKKEHGLSIKASSAKKYAVHIQVANFTTKQSAFALRTKRSQLASSDTLTDLSGYIDQFYYVVIDSTLNLVKTIVQDSTYCSSMGTITDSLPAGRYYIALVAGKNGLKIGTPGQLVGTYGYAGEPWQGTFFSAYPDGYLGLHWQDTFEDEFTITVGTQNINQTVTLNRVVGKLEVTLLDNIPANADSLFVSNFGPGPAGLNGGFFPVNNTYSFAIPASAKGQPNFTVDMLLYNNTGGYLGAVDPGKSFTITCKDAGGNVLGTSTANAVAVYPNQKTILSGNLFTGSGNNGSPQTFTAVADTTWAQESRR